MKWAYYNEWDARTAAWLRELIARGLVAPGEVDERSIAEVSADDVRGFAQCHFFAGIGGWPHGLRLAGWSDDRPVWTGSCPCPPFSAAGKGQECPSCGGRHALSHPLVTGGWVCLDCGDEWRADIRHLSPEFVRLIAEGRPPSVFGEQVATAAGRVWLGALSAVVETLAYPLVGSDLCAAGIGAPHIRQRLYFGAERLADAYGGDASAAQLQRGGEHGFQPEGGGVGGCGDRGAWPRSGGLADGNGAGCRVEPERHGASGAGGQGAQPGPDTARRGDDLRPGPVNGFWRDADWLGCRDGKWRPVEPGLEPLADGVPARVVRLRGYGNAIVPQLAAAFIEAFEESKGAAE